MAEIEMDDKIIALLIDGENISHRYLDTVLDELIQLGSITYKRIYCDFKKKSMKEWDNLASKYGMIEVQQSANVKGKNSSDSALIIDAMDILYKGKVDCFCLATSDSDFTRLAVRLREETIFVIGAGEEKTAESFRNACDRFIILDKLLPKETKESQSVESSGNQAQIDSNKITEKRKQTQKNLSAITLEKQKQSDNNSQVLAKEKKKSDVSDKSVLQIESEQMPLEKLYAICSEIINRGSDGDGWMNFSAFMSQLTKKDNSFNPQNYGSRLRPINFFKEVKIDSKKPFILRRDKEYDEISLSNSEFISGRQLIRG